MIPALRFLYRYLFCRKGHGVHSPFVYDLITNVIEEAHPYYCYEPLKRKYFALRKHNGKYLSRKEYELLFRIANRFKPAKSLVIAEDSGLSALYVTAFSRDAVCICPDSAVPRNEGCEKYGLIVCHCPTPDTVRKLFDCAGYETVMTVSGIGNPSVEKKLWRYICEHPKVSVTIDLHNIKLIFFNPKLHRKTYKSVI